MFVRLTQADRFLVALQDAHQHLASFEMPARFSQNGLSDRLGMAQSHISRATKSLFSNGLITKQKRRVAGEVRRVNTYIPTERGIERIDELLDNVISQEVFTPGKDGLLKRMSYGDLLNDWRVQQIATPYDALGISDLLHQAPIHENLPLLETEAIFDNEFSDMEADLASETIGYLLELATLQKNSGQFSKAFSSLNRASQLHRQRGSPSGEITCLIAAHGVNMGGGNEQVTRKESFNRLIELCNRVEASEIKQSWWQPLADILPKEEKKKWLLKIWQTKPGLPIAGHVGFALLNLGEQVGDELLEIFQSAGDENGYSAVKKFLQ